MPLRPFRAAVFFAAAFAPALCAQTVPATLNYQGRLTDNGTTPAPITATVNMSFEIWDVASGGTAGVDRLWIEPASGSIPVSVTGGVFSIQLGANGVPVPPALFAGGATRWLQIIANGETLAPRQALAAAAYANQAQNAAAAASAANSAALGGLAAAGWQKATVQNCLAGSFVSAIAADGTSSCASASGTLTPPVALSGNLAGAIFSSTNSGTGSAISASAGGNALYSYSTNAEGIYGVTTGGVGVAGYTAGAGSAGRFSINNATSASAALTSTTNGTGNAIVGVSGAGSGAATGFNHAGLVGDADTGYGVVGKSNTGSAATFQINNAANSSPAMYAVTSGTGNAGYFSVSNGASPASALNVQSSGTGSTLYVASSGNGRVGEFRGNSAGYGGDVVSVIGTGTGDVINGYAQGTSGRAGYFSVSNASSASPALYAYASGSGAGLDATSATGDGVRGTAAAAGLAGIHGIANGSAAFQTSKGVLGESSTGDGVMGSGTSGATGVAARSDTGIALDAYTGSGTALNAYTNTTAADKAAGYLSNPNGYALQAETYYGATGATGTAVVRAIADNGTNFFVGCIGNRTACANKFRVDQNGAVFANGGFVGSGADVAEFIDASGDPQPGDVVEIDPDRDGKFRKAASALSPAVAGVVTTRPGLTMNAGEAAAGEAGGPALALVGRVPVKVSAMNGAIRRGDLLVSSPLAGRAMKAPANPPPGTLIGKAMGELAAGEGTIEMLVMLR